MQFPIILLSNARSGIGKEPDDGATDIASDQQPSSFQRGSLSYKRCSCSESSGRVFVQGTWDIIRRLLTVVVSARHDALRCL